MIEMNTYLRQIPSNPLTMVATRSPCNCKSGLCSCCTGMIISAFKSKGCMKLRYIPEEFAFEFKMMMNDHVLYKNTISGRNPQPVCIAPARIPFVDVCATFSDIYFFGRNMHICLEVGAFFDGYELYNRYMNRPSLIPLFNLILNFSFDFFHKVIRLYACWSSRC